MGLSSCHAECFEREMGCSEADWLRWLPEAVGDHEWSLQGRLAKVELGNLNQSRIESTDQDDQPAASAGLRPCLTLSWQPLPQLTIALLSLPRLRVSFKFEGVGEAERQQFMRRFDLYLQRGGG